MAQRRSLAWTELRVGLLVLLSFGLLAAAIFLVGGQAGLFTRTYKITIFFASANGLRPGAEVWLEGVTIGNVKEVRISQQAQTDVNKSVEVDVSIDKRFQQNIRDNIHPGCTADELKTPPAPCTIAAISTIGVLGDKNIELTRGTRGEPVPDGGYLQGTETGDIKRIIESSNDLVTNLKDLSDTILEMSNKIRKGEGTLGKLMNDTSIYDNLDKATREANALVYDAHHGKGTVGRLLSDDELYQQMKTTVSQFNMTIDQLNNTIAQIRTGTGTVAKMLNDPALYDQAKDLIGRFQSIADRIDRGEGTIGKLAKDDQLYNDFREVSARASSLISAIENGEGTAGRLIKDPQLYNSFNQASSEIQKLLYDIRQNPKKFLTITFRLF
jgi:phospholipid/cholesterol/gamma-HCH transport system substrate-binding protein